MDTSVVMIFKSQHFWACFCAWLVAQFTKMLVGFLRTRRLDFSYLVSTGGMPSAHSAAACGLATSIGLVSGFGSAIAILAITFAAFTMFDASTVRRAAGMQARLLNEIIDELFKEHHLSERKLVELLGHTRLEVFMGMAVGIFVAMIVYSVPVLR
jgi:acid phosphatase family membrane protein YuiD